MKQQCQKTKQTSQRSTNKKTPKYFIHVLTSLNHLIQLWLA